MTPALSGITQAQQRWNNLSNKEITWQTELIRISTSFITSKNDLQIAPTTRVMDIQPKKIISKSVLTDELSKILDEIEACAFQDENGIRWIGLNWLQDSEVAQLGTIDFDLYNGMSGIGLFLAAHHHVFKDQKSRLLVQKVLFTLREALNMPASVSPLNNIGIGGASGLGSIVYSLATIALLMEDDSIFEDAARAANLITLDLIKEDQYLDVISGSADAILGLLALYRHKNSPIVLSKATACGEHC